MRGGIHGGDPGVDTPDMYNPETEGPFFVPWGVLPGGRQLAWMYDLPFQNPEHRNRRVSATLHVNGEEGWKVKVTEPAGRRRRADGPIDHWMYQRTRALTHLRAHTDRCAYVYTDADRNACAYRYASTHGHAYSDRYTCAYLNTHGDRHVRAYLYPYADTDSFAYVDPCTCINPSSCVNPSARTDPGGNDSCAYTCPGASVNPNASADCCARIDSTARIDAWAVG